MFIHKLDLNSQFLKKSTENNYDIVMNQNGSCFHEIIESS
jgi:hypothetical protein